LAYGEAAPRQFGGVGVMIDEPASELLVGPRVQEKSEGEGERATQRAREFAERFRSSLDPSERPAVAALRIRVERAAPDHVGLGSGTQLAMAVARAMAAFCGRPELPPEELARRVGRGGRSALGVHGFQRGGFLVEGGKRDASSIAPLVAALQFPAEWRFVLVIPSRSKGLHGAAERDAFEGLAPIAPEVTANLTRLTLLGMLPAIAESDFPAFSECLFEFGQKVGRCFAACQGGVFSTPFAAAVAEAIRARGLRGVAQSSWGPTICAVTSSELEARWLAARLPDSLGDLNAQLVCTPANQHGAKVEVIEG
jgi:beta-RFAP synthase